MGPASASGSGAGSTVYSPPGQAGAAGALGNIFSPLYGASMNGGAGTPGAWAWPQAQSFVGQSYNPTQQYLTGSPTGAPTLFDQSTGLGYGSAMNASNLYEQGVGNIYGQIPGLAQGAGSALSYLPQIMQSAFNPLYQQQVDAAANNPFYQTALGGAQQAATLGGQGANQLYGAGSSIMQQGFDPQSALRNRTQQQLTDQLGAVNAMTGVGSSPYGAGVMGKGLSNFDIDWQNQQLQRQATAAGAASPLLQAAPGLAAGSAALPSQAYMSHIGDILGALKAQQGAQGMGASAFGSLLGSAGQGLGQAQSLLGSSTGGLASSGMLPYQSGAQFAQGALGGLGSQQNLLTGATQLGNNQYQLPQQMIDDLMKYLGLGQSASNLSGQLGQMGFNQTASGIGGLFGGANMLFNPTSGMFPGALAGLGAMFSDRRLKDDVTPLGTLPNGLPFYSFRYIWDDVPRIGLMADEVERLYPDAVTTGRGGYKAVDYARAMR